MLVIRPLLVSADFTRILPIGPPRFEVTRRGARRRAVGGGSSARADLSRGSTEAALEARFTAEEREGLLDFWQVYESSLDVINERRKVVFGSHPILGPGLAGASDAERAAAAAHARVLVERATHGDWSGYEQGLSQHARTYVAPGVRYQTWVDLFVDFRRTIAPRLTAAYADQPARLAWAQHAFQTFLDQTLAFLGQAFIDAEEQVVRRQAAELRELEHQRAQLFDNSPAPMWVFAADSGRFLTVNAAAIRHYGYSRAEFERMTIWDLRPDEDHDRLREHLKNPPVLSDIGRWRHRKADGSDITVEVVGHAVVFDSRPARLVVVHDVTQQVELAEQLRQSQKMEAVGQLAGGVAHDFNNLLTVILSCGELARDELPSGSPAVDDLDEILRAAGQAASLTRQLLAFSRKQRLKTEVIDLRDLVTGSEGIFRRLVGDEVDLVTRAAPDLARVRVDRSHFDQVLLNLVVNARDAMHAGGRLTVELFNAELDDRYVRGHIGAKPGSYVVLSVTDTGVGMDDATQLRIFEPFFTTKPLGSGTGLGLSTVFGIVKQADGDVRVYSAVGKGTTMRIYLPAVDASEPLAPASPRPAPARGAGEPVLLVEDDPAVRAVARRALRSGGFRLIEAATPAEALAIAEDPGVEIALLLTDVVMPGMNGRELADRVLPTRPGIRVLYVSGYSGGAMAHQGIVPDGASYLQKPFTPDALLRAVRATIDQG